MFTRKDNEKTVRKPESRMASGKRGLNMKIILTAVLMLAGSLLFAETKTYSPYGWNTWKRDEHAGQFQRIQPGGKYADGAMRIIPDADKDKIYSLQVYGDVPIKGDEAVKITARITSSKNISPDATVQLGVDIKEANGDWVRGIKLPSPSYIDVVAGTEQQLSIEFDLKACNSDKIAFICPTLIVNHVKEGEVILLPVTLETSKSNYVPQKDPEGPGLAGYTIQSKAFKNFKWEGPVESQKFQKLMDYAALGLNIVELKPANKAVAWQWPMGDTLTAVYADDAWEISYGRTPDKQETKLTINGSSITAAAYGSGVVFRDSNGKDYLVEGGMDQEGMTLLHADGTPELQVRQLYIANDAESLCWVEEARRELKDVQKIYEGNKNYLVEMYGIYNVSRAWENTFTYHAKYLNAFEQEAMNRTEGYGKILIADPVLRDRYNQLVWFSYNEHVEDMGYFGGVFNKTWYTHLGGAGPIVDTFTFARRLREAVAQARRVGGANFKEGAAAGDILATGWVNNLSHVFQKAGNNDKLAKTLNIEVARGEAEDAQLVLTTGCKAVNGISVAVKSDSEDAPSIQFYKTDYIHVIATPTAKLPYTYAGDSGVPDVLIPIADGKTLDMAKFTNLPVQLRIRVPRDAKAGDYSYTVTVTAEGESTTLPLTVKVHNFTFPERPLPNMGGIRPSTFNSWYKERTQEARRNLSLEMLDCMLEPLDLYVETPIVEDEVWSIENGFHGWNLGSNLNSLADPQPGMLKFVKLYGSKDGKTFEWIPAKFSLVQRDANDPLSDVDLLAVPEKSVAEYRYLKLHNSETRGWADRCNYSFFSTYNNKELGGAMELTFADGSKETRFDLTFLQPDKSPATTGTADFKAGGNLTFDNLRDATNRGSVLWDKGDTDIKEILLLNRFKQVHLESMRKFYDSYVKNAQGKAEIYTYGFDEVEEHLNTRIISALKNTKIAFPGVKAISTAANPDANPEIFDLLDIHCPDNGYAVPRFNKRMHDEHGIDYWTYIGGGAYYPFGNFERVDQPLVNSRAFMWEPIAFDHIKGFLYWDIHMWRNNENKIGKDIDWSTWIDNHGDNNGMGAIFYPGPDAKAYPSRRSHAMRDGIEDYAAFTMAKEKIAAKGNSPELLARLAEIRKNFATGMSVFNHDADSVQANRLALYKLLDELE